MTVRIEAPPEKVRRLIELRRQVAGRASKDPFGLLGYTPTAKQAEFHAAGEYDVLYGGAAGGGKTKALLMEGLRACAQHPGIRIAAVRRTMVEHKESLLAELETVELHLIGARYNGQDHEVRFVNRSVLRFIYLEDMIDATRRQGGQYQMLLFDEVTLTPPNVVGYLRSRMRSGRPDLPPPRVRSTCNPGGIGHSYVKQRYVLATDHGQHPTVDAQGRPVRFIQAKATDNPHLNVEYYAELDAIEDPQLRRAMRDGDWDQFAGQYFATWQFDRHVVPAFTLPPTWRRHAGIDYGFAAPWAVLWAAVDNDGRVWLYREMYDTQVTERDQATRVRTAEGGFQNYPVESVVHHADPSMWSKTGAAPSPAMAYAAVGVQLIRAVNDRVPGWQRVHTFLADGPACQLHRQQGRDTCPMLHVFDGCCPNLVRTLPALPRSPARPEDVDTHAEDHAADALRYLLMGVSTGGQSLQVVRYDTDQPALGGGDGWTDFDSMTANY